ncbi:MAG: low molecular weight phosphotyrosine protein phosphatase [Nocardioides sp.]|nr:low molecular weight phosphotyrosine protein phosphatase [Nocardioides sp.]
MRIAIVCLGNICRSPMADVVLNARLEAAGLAELVHVDSYGTGGWHVGNPMDERAAARLTRVGYDATAHRARQFSAGTDEDYDLVLAMDQQNLDDLRDLGVPPEKLELFRDHDPQPGDRDVPDPYYGGTDGFSHVLAIIERTAEALTDELAHDGGKEETRR